MGFIIFIIAVMIFAICSVDVPWENTLWACLGGIVLIILAAFGFFGGGGGGTHISGMFKPD